MVQQTAGLLMYCRATEVPRKSEIRRVRSMESGGQLESSGQLECESGRLMLPGGSPALHQKAKRHHLTG